MRFARALVGAALTFALIWTVQVSGGCVAGTSLGDAGFTCQTSLDCAPGFLCIGAICRAGPAPAPDAGDSGSGSPDAGESDGGGDAGPLGDGGADAGHPALALVQAVVPPNSGANAFNSLVTLPNPENSGNFLVAVAAYQLEASPVRVSDTLSNTWVPLNHYDNANCVPDGGPSNGWFSGVQVWYATEIVGGQNTIALTTYEEDGGAAMEYQWLGVLEYAGVDPAGPIVSVGQVSSAIPTGSLSTGSMTATASRSIVLGVFHDEASYGFDAGAPFVELGQDNGMAVMIEQLAGVPASNYDATATMTNPDTCWVTAGVVFPGY
jgi:hypothetical protein